MRVLVTGGTGFIGRGLVASLREHGDDVVVVSRTPDATAVPWGAIEDEVERADGVVHLAGEPIADGRWTKSRLDSIRASRVQSTERIARAIEKASSRPHVFVSASAVGIYGTTSGDRELDESSPPGEDVLARIVVDWEKAASLADLEGVRVVHPRISVVLGRGGGALAKMAAPFRWFVGGPIGSGRQWVSWIHVRDAVRALRFVLHSEKASGPVNVAAPEPATMDAFAHAIGGAMHRPAALRVPPVALRVALGRGLAQTLLTGQRAIPRKLLDLGFAFEFTRIEPACADLLARGEFGTGRPEGRKD